MTAPASPLAIDPAATARESRRMRLSWLALAATIPSVALAQPAAGPPGSTEPTTEPAPAPAPAPDPDYDGAAYIPPTHAKDIVITTAGARSSSNMLTIGAIAGAGALFGAIGVYYN